MTAPRTIRVFVSSPGDVEAERKRVDFVAERLNGIYAGRVGFETIRWELKFYSAHDTFQAQIAEAKTCDIVIGILWARLGTELPPDFPPMPDGTPYPSGTAYELLSAIEWRREREAEQRRDPSAPQPRPDVYIFLKKAPPFPPPRDENDLADLDNQWKKLKTFVERHLTTAEGHYIGASHSFVGTDEFEQYIRDLRWAQEFAAFNRAEMMDRTHRCLEDFMGGSVRIEETIQCHHNYTERMADDLVAQWKLPKGRRGSVWLSRKGAIDASEGRPGLIPGSMGTRSYVVTGLGNRMSLNSSPHGAGRQHSRTKARKLYSLAELEEAMTGIEWRHTDAFLDEIPAAYKDIDVVMEDAKDLVEINHTLRQIVNIKGD